MVTLLISSVVLLGLIAIAIYYWQKPNTQSTVAEVIAHKEPRGLFDTSDAYHTLAPVPDTAYKEYREDLLKRTEEGDKSALQDAARLSDANLYDQILSTLVNQCSSPSQLLSLVSFVTRSELEVNETLAVAVMQSWQNSPDRVSTAKMLHIAALSDSAETYRRAVEVVLRFWREKRIPGLTAIELQALLNGEFWVLSTSTRSSGAGFLLKRTLASARRELEANSTII